jgi:hypothetical protein
MTYKINLLKRGKHMLFSETLLDGLINNEFILHTRSDFVERLGLCDKCYGSICHVICNDADPNGYTNKFCPVLFHDLIKPQWKLEDVNGFEENMELSQGHFEKRRLSDVWED